MEPIITPAERAKAACEEATLRFGKNTPRYKDFMTGWRVQEAKSVTTASENLYGASNHKRNHYKQEQYNG